MTLAKNRITNGSKSVLALLLVALGVVSPVPMMTQASAASAPVSATPNTGQLPALGEGSDLTIGDERRLGDRIIRELYRDPDYIDDPVVADYLQDIWQPLLAAARARGELTPELDERFAWQILLGRDRTVNAFALPGGYFGVHLGLIAIVSSRDELASVLGHELSHVTQRHISRLMAKQGQQTPWMIGAMILGVLAASKSPDAGNALILGGQAITAQNQLNFSRDMEREADRIGFGVMTQAGFEAEGFVTMFDKLQLASRLNDNGAYPYLRSHPLTTERIADMHSRLLLAAPGPVPVLTAEHAMVSARARVLSNPGVDALRALRVEANPVHLATLPTARQVAALYGAALAASQFRDFTQALGYVDQLTRLVRADAPAARLARLLTTEIALAAGDAARAARVLNAMPASQKTGSDTVARRPELMLGAQVALQMGPGAGLSEAAQSLQSWVLAHPHDAQAWQLLSSVYGAQGQTLRGIRAGAESQVAMLDYAAAMDRFNAAQQFLRQPQSGADHVEASIIATRRHQVEALLKEQTLDR
jgi:predicted Zn-dependent protease